LKNRLDLKSREVQQQLDGLPQSFADNPQARLLSLCGEFVSEMVKYVHGDASCPSFFQEINIEFGKLADGILGTRPLFDIPSAKDSFPQPQSLSDSLLSEHINIAMTESSDVRERGTKRK